MTPVESFSTSESEFYTSLVEVFHLPARYFSRIDRYFLLHWTPQYTLSQWRPAGVIIRDGIEYHITGRERADVACWSHDSYVRLSFRKSVDMTYGFVLIRRGK